MQKVVCPTTIVQMDSSYALKLKKARSAIPVMIPGSARGRTNRKLIASRPKNAKRWIANAAQVPSTSASAVAARAVLTDSTSAVRTSGSLQVELNHFVLRFDMGHVSMFDSLKAYRNIKRMGMNRNSTMSTVQIRKAILVQKPSIYDLTALQTLQGVWPRGG